MSEPRDFPIAEGLGLTSDELGGVWEYAVSQLTAEREGSLTPTMSEAEIVALMAAEDFAAPRDAREVLAVLAGGLERGQVATADPRYFGLLHAAPASIAIAAGALAAAHNPQLATRSHAPFAVALEDHLVRALGAKLGFDDADGIFTSGGAEANAVALFTALVHTFPDVVTKGVRALPGQPVAYVSAEGHPTIARAAKSAGLGSDAVRVIPADGAQRMKVQALGEAIARDRVAGMLPFFVGATAGTTGSGAIDPLAEVARLRNRPWLHVDAAWGGLLALVPSRRSILVAMSEADSITFDPHKALALPLGTGMFFTRHREVLARAYAERAGYMPRNASRDPYARGPIWSRRFAGAALYAVLASAGWDGIARTLERQLALADRLRDGLREGGFRIVNESPLPVVCFVDAADERPAHMERLVRAVITEDAGWLSLTRLSSGVRVARACITNHRTREDDVDHLVRALVSAKS